MAKTNEFSLAQLSPKESNALAYPNHDRANDLYGFFMTGYTEDEIALFMGMDVSEVQKDLMYVNTKLSVRQIIQHNNDRSRILLQRENSLNFQNLMKDSLSTSAETLIAAGLSPASILKEYREATGMVQKAEPLLQINTQINNQPTASSGGIQSTEDVIRRVLNQINQSVPESPEIIDAEVSDQEDLDDSDYDTDRDPEPET